MASAFSLLRKRTEQQHSVLRQNLPRRNYATAFSAYLVEDYTCYELFERWDREELNLRPPAYQAGALNRLSYGPVWYLLAAP